MSEPIVSEKQERIGLVRINRPDKLNAVDLETMDRLVTAMEHFDRDPEVRCMLLTGDERAFGAGVDITEMADASMAEMYYRNQFARWDQLWAVQKPIVAAVSGYAIGGGCELVMSCDIIIASETARFGQPETGIGVIPGAGGTQRVTRAIGKARAMDLILTGRMITAQEALEAGLVSRVVPLENYYDEALGVCRELAKRPPLALRLAKEAILRAHAGSLRDGLDYERKLFYTLFATDDQKEGMRAFIEKRPPVYVGR